VRAASADKLALYVFQRNVRARRFYEAQEFSLCTLGTGATNEEREPDAYYEWHRPVPIPGGRWCMAIAFARARYLSRASGDNVLDSFSRVR
jgi:hypothetical protein